MLGKCGGKIQIVAEPPLGPDQSADELPSKGSSSFPRARNGKKSLDQSPLSERLQADQAQQERRTITVAQIGLKLPVLIASIDIPWRCEQTVHTRLPWEKG